MVVLDVVEVGVDIDADDRRVPAVEALPDLVDAHGVGHREPAARAAAVGDGAGIGRFGRPRGVVVLVIGAVGHSPAALVGNQGVGGVGARALVRAAVDLVVDERRAVLVTGLGYVPAVLQPLVVGLLVVPDGPRGARALGALVPDRRHLAGQVDRDTQAAGSGRHEFVLNHPRCRARVIANPPARVQRFSPSHGLAE
jgi:hypothetical protein